MPSDEPAHQPTTPQEIFGQNLRAAREARNMSQADLVEELARHGVNLHRQTVHKIEHAGRPLKVDEAVAIAEALESDLDAMLRAPSNFRLHELAATIEEKRSEAIRVVGEMYELQQRLASFLDSDDDGEGDMFTEYLDWSAVDLHDRLIDLLIKSKELRRDATSPVINSLYKTLPDYYDLTVDPSRIRGPYMRRFLDTHPGLEREDGDGER